MAIRVPEPMSSTKTPRPAPRNRSGPPAQPSAAALARSAARKKTWTRRNDPWTRIQDAKLLKAWHQDKTGQELADAVGDGRTEDECEDRLHGKSGLVPKRRFLAYAWDPTDPLKHSAAFRAALPVSLQNMQAPQIKELWLEESQSTCILGVQCVVNCGLERGWNSKSNCAEILGEMRLHPDFLEQRPKPRLTKAFSDRSQILFSMAEATQRHRQHCMKLLSGDNKLLLADLNDGNFEKKDRKAYDKLKWKAACGDVIGDGADVETQMPKWAETPEISQRTVKPPFEPVPVDANLSNPAFARQFRRLDQSFDLYTGRSGCMCPKRAPPTRPERPESSVRHYVASICKHRPVLRHLLLPLFAQGRPRLRRALQEEEASAVHQRRLSCL